MEKPKDTSFDDMLKKINSIQKKVVIDSKDRSSTWSEPKIMSTGLDDISARNDSRSIAETENKLRTFSNSSIGQLEKFSGFKPDDSQFLNEFFGVKNYSIHIPEYLSTQQTSQFTDTKSSIKNEMEKILYQNYRHYLADEICQIRCNESEWMDYKLSFDQKSFIRKDGGITLWDDEIRVSYDFIETRTE
ncbi:hypothetical protein RF11_10753 [Thelohanellus kitauei]|uniref:Uncharacterized protein n=1 Tax=Thelohanellus kitauei TaxID=669202 RepID=A0A0C2MTJ4_THEKT|nr:hypothetical protein RF11_10753 [Thelohanellus kitauei]